jgi:hypothetical protein
LGSISGIVQEDTNGTGDAILQNVLVTLLDENGDVIATTLSESNGSFVFSGLPAGTYTVTETNLKDYTDVSVNVFTITLAAGVDSTDNKFVDELQGSICVFVKEDTNFDGVGDRVLENVWVTLLDGSGKEIRMVKLYSLCCLLERTF